MQPSAAKRRRSAAKQSGVGEEGRRGGEGWGSVLGVERGRTLGVHAVCFILRQIRSSLLGRCLIAYRPSLCKEKALFCVCRMLVSSHAWHPSNTTRTSLLRLAPHLRSALLRSAPLRSASLRSASLRLGALLR